MDEPLLQFFAYQHLKPELQQYSAPFGVLAQWLVENLGDFPEREVALRKLLEAKDCAVRVRWLELNATVGPMADARRNDAS